MGRFLPAGWPVSDPAATLPDRSHRCRVCPSGSAAAASEGHRSTQTASDARDLERYLLRRSERLCLAVTAARVPGLADHLSLLPAVASGWHVGALERRPA